MGTQLDSNQLGNVAPGGRRPSTATVDGSALAQGIAQIGAAADRRNQVLDVKADKVAALHEQQFLADYEPARAQREADYTGATPGYSGQELSAYDAARSGFATQDLDPRVQRLLGQRLDARRLSVGDSAIQYEAAKRGQQEDRRRTLTQNASDTNALVPILQAMHGAARDTHTAWDGKSAGLTDASVAAVTGAAQPYLDAITDPDQKLRLATMVANEKNNIISKSMTAEDDGQTAHLYTTATDAADAVAKSAFDDPSVFKTASTAIDHAADALPGELKDHYRKDALDAVTASMAEGYRARSDVAGLTAMLAQPEIKAAMSPKTFEAYDGYVKSTAAAATQALAQDTAERSLSNAVTVAMQTGQDSGFDGAAYAKAYGPVEGPVRAQAAARQVQLATQSHAIVAQANGLSYDDFVARMAVYKPTDPKDPDYAVKQQLYTQALDMGKQLGQARLADPAGVDAANPDSAPRWDAVQAGRPGAAKDWADYTLGRQAAWGIGETAQRVLPAGAAKSMVKALDTAPADQKPDVMGTLLAQAAAFGPDNAGRVLKELQAAGLNGSDAAMMNASDGNPIVLGRYTRAVERNKTAPRLDKATTDAITKAVDKAFTPFGASYGYNSDGQVYADNLRNAAIAMTTANVHDGESSYDKAAKAAVGLIAGQYVIEPKQGFRVPVAVAGNAGLFGMGADTPYTVQRGTFDTPMKTNGMGAIMAGSQRFLADYWLREPLYPADASPGLTKEQSARKEALEVRNSGHWINTDDDSGLQLVVIDPRTRGPRPVLGADQKPIIKTWDQLIQRAGKGE